MTTTNNATHGFELLREQEIPELKTIARFYRHVKTGAELLSLINEDENKCFGINFRTPPSDSTGVAHILEHSVLCGSRKYPLKEPFIELAKGSLKTFLNAMTYPDKTCYPVASTNTQDFYNLVDVYLDAVLYPRLTPQTLQQEGWHYELEKLDDPLVYKGVVFNEMKGVYSSPDSVLYEKSQQSLFPDITYGVDSGGNPRHIPDLTYEQLLNFHRSYYHPSNSRLFFYGDDDPEERLRLLNEWLQEFERLEVDSAVRLQPRFTEPKKLTTTYPAGEEDAQNNKGMVMLNWMMDEVTDPSDLLALHIMAHTIMYTPASPLKKALIDSGLGEDVVGGFYDGLRQVCFQAGLKGITVEDADKVEALILETLTKLAQEGIDPAMIEAAYNLTEFRLRENNTGSFPRGLALMLNALDTWLHGYDPLAPLAFEKPLADVKARLQSGRYFESLIAEYLLQNPHRTTVILTPDPEQDEREEAEEKARLEAVRAQLSADELQAIIEETHYLKLLQDTPDPPETLALIPSLKLSDLDRRNKTIPLAELQHDDIKILYHDLFTNGIIYFDAGFNLHLLPSELLPYLHLFGRALTQIGTEKEDFVRLIQRIGSKTGGVWAQSVITSVREAQGSASQPSTAWLFLRGKALPSQANDLLAIMRDVLCEVKVDNRERFNQMALEEKARMESALVPSGSHFVNTRLRSHFTEAGWINEQMGGISYLFFLRDLVERIENDWPSVLATLEAIRSTLVNRSAMICNVTTDAATYDNFEPKLRSFLNDLPAAPPVRAPWTPEFGLGFEGLTIPAAVNYVGKGANLYRLGYQEHGSAHVITNYLNTTWLWERVRMRGGAYGAFCGFDSATGIFSYGSYRDPNLLETIANYDNTAQFLREAELSDIELTRSIIGVISDMDFYQLPDAKGFSSLVRYLAGDTDEMRQRRRDEVLSTTRTDFRNFADALEQVKEHGLVVVLGSEADLKAVNEARPGWLKMLKVL